MPDTPSQRRCGEEGGAQLGEPDSLSELGDRARSIKLRLVKYDKDGDGDLEGKASVDWVIPGPL